MATPQDSNSSANQMWPCRKCGNIYATKAGEQQHFSKYCSKRPDDTSNCPFCNASFPTYAGLRLHQKRAHPAQHNEALQEEAVGVKKRWTADEEKELAKIEASMVGETATAIITALAEKSGRTREAIKGRRRMESYKTLVSFYRTPPTEQLPTPAPYGNEDSSRLNQEILSYIETLPNNTWDADDSVLLSAMRSDFSNTHEANIRVYESIVARFGSENTTSSQSNANLINALNNAPNNRKRKRILYKLTQREYSSNKSGCADRILDNLPWTVIETTPADAEILSQFEGTFGCYAETRLPEAYNSGFNNTVIAKPITKEEVDAHVRSLSSNTPGPDGITKKNLKKIPIQKLTLLFNALLIAEDLPDGLKRNRTFLIPKTSTQLENPKNWRPITISSIILRVFNRILAKRLNNIELQENQRGFTQIDGCFANTWSVENLIKHHRLKGKPLTLISLDLAAAFDSVPHNAILRALRRTKVDNKYINLVEASFANSSTTIHCNGRTIGTVPILRGVKQGDPASPVHFNIFMDELIATLDEDFDGINIDGNKVTCLAYADDIILVAGVPDDGKRMLKKTLDFLTSMSMSVNAKKCSSFVLKTVPSKKKVCLDTRTVFKINSTAIPKIDTEGSFKYLGENFTFTGLSPPSLGNLFDQLKRISRAPLKPHQKLSILKEYLVPRYIAQLQKPNINRKVLKMADAKIRKAARCFLHLNSRCHSSVFHAPVKYGGLGLFNFSDNIPIIIKARIDKLRNASPQLNAIFQLATNRLNNICKMIKPGSTTKTEIEEKHHQLLENSFSGNGLSQAKYSPASSKHLSYPPKCWNGEDYIRSIQLRFNLLPCAGIPSNPPEARNCRAGCNRKESNSHIMQRCPISHANRIKRHNYIVKRLTNIAVRKNWAYQLEPNIRCRDGILKKPDVILMKGNELIICDVGVHWEGPLSLSSQYNTKVAIYSTPNFIDAVKERYPQHNIFVLPFIMGARGIWCRENRFMQHHLNMTGREMADIVTTTIRGSYSIHRNFMKYVWRRRPPPRRR